MKQRCCQHVGTGRKIPYFSVLKTKLIRISYTVENYPLFLLPCNLRTYKNVVVWILNLIGYAKDRRTIISLLYEGGWAIVFNRFSLSSGSENSKQPCSLWNSYKWLTSKQQLPWREKKFPPTASSSPKLAFDFNDEGFFLFVALLIQAKWKQGSLYWAAVGCWV